MKQTAPDVHHPKPDILIVDDTPENLTLLTEMLKESGYRVRPVPSGKLALQAIEHGKPDLILLDINMPEMNGYEVCAHLKADPDVSDIPVLFISALTETMDKMKAFSVGGVDYVTKPFHVEEVHARVETHLRIRFLQRQLSDQNKNLEQQVAERTRELMQAHKRLLELGQLKNDFLSMISHELRTPANGILGVGHMILTLCPPSEAREQAAALFEQSSLRLQNLIDDAAMIADMEALALEDGATISFSDLFKAVAQTLPDLQIDLEQPPVLHTVFLKGCYPLLKNALKSIVLLAASFSTNKHAVHGDVKAEEQDLRVQLKLDALSLSAEQAADFFNIESRTRSSSTAESLGLAPVVAYQIITAFGGKLSLIKQEDDTGVLEVLFLNEPDRTQDRGALKPGETAVPEGVLYSRGCVFFAEPTAG